MGRYKNKVVFTSLVLGVLVTGIACFYFLKQNNHKTPPEITVKINNQMIGTELGLNQWDGMAYDREDTFKTLMKKSSDIPYFHLGDMISIQFKKNEPDEITVMESILTAGGDYKYSDRTEKKVVLNQEDKIYSFQLEPNTASYLSSDLSDYDQGKSIRGFRIVCSWGANECEYGFILRTDPMAAQVENEEAVQEETAVFHAISQEGNTLAARIKPPKDYVRTKEGKNSFGTFMRKLPLKEDGSPVLLYNGNEKNNQNAHIAVFDMDIGEKDLQQCADSIMRMYGEYYFASQEYDKIKFHLTNNYLMEYTKWRGGCRLKVNGNQTSMVKTASYDDSYEAFRKYLETVFIYGGTVSLSGESNETRVEEIQIEDMFIEAGSPGHCVLIVDMAGNEDGEKALLLAQGYMPAQEFHILKNPLHEEDPWYYTSEFKFPLETPQWTFKEGSLKRWMK